MIDRQEPLVTTKSARVRKLLFDNPMQVEVSRFRRRFINVTDSPKLNQSLSWLVVLSYVIICGLVFATRSDIPVQAIAQIQLVLMVLGAIVSSHGAIAGEKDRRSWDLLQAAPITQQQIVFGKFMSSATLAVAIELIFLPLMLMTRAVPVGWLGNLLLIGAANLLCLSVSFFASALSIYLSARCKNANTTLVASVGSAAVMFIGVPLLLVSLTPPGQLIEAFLHLYHPTYWLWRLLEVPYSPFGNGIFYPASTLWLTILGYLGVTVGMLLMTSRRLTAMRSKD